MDLTVFAIPFFLGASALAIVSELLLRSTRADLALLETPAALSHAQTAPHSEETT